MLKGEPRRTMHPVNEGVLQFWNVGSTSIGLWVTQGKGGLWARTEKVYEKLKKNAIQLPGFEMMIMICLILTLNMQFNMGSTEQQIKQKVDATF